MERISPLEVAGLGLLVERSDLVEPRPPVFEALVTGRAALVQAGRAEGAQRSGRRAAALGGEDLQRVCGRRVAVLLRVPNDLAQVPRQVLTGERQALACQPDRPGGRGALALSRAGARGDVTPHAGAAGRQRGRAGGRPGRRLRLMEVMTLLLDDRMVVRMVVMRVMEGTGTTVLHRLSGARLKRFL